MLLVQLEALVGDLAGFLFYDDDIPERVSEKHDGSTWVHVSVRGCRQALGQGVTSRKHARTGGSALIGRIQRGV